MEFPAWFKAAAEVVAEVSEPPEGLKSVDRTGEEPLTPDEAIAGRGRDFPHARFDHLHPPAGPEGHYEVAFRQPGEVQRSFGRSQVFLDQYSGEVPMVRSPETFTAADAFFTWQFPLHNGEAFGLVGRWVVFFVGLSPVVLYVTGAVVWWRRKRPRRERRGRAASRPEPQLGGPDVDERPAGQPPRSPAGEPASVG